MDSINTDQPAAGSDWSPVSEVGWVYSPDFSYTLTGIQTRFGDTGAPPTGAAEITVEVYYGLPGAGTLLRSANFYFSGWPGFFIGGSFEPLQIVAGEDYFIGFRNISYMWLNSAWSGTMLSAYGDNINDGTYSNIITGDNHIHPILQFHGVPEPSTLLLLSFSVILLRKKF
ncbi:MAG: PEP-CTERM sorting domain-containing protein [Planctomycetota bacterium]|nr:MAG: PEP-CTERM sorting domain-containing protein [Planctomycetota bacterium]